MTLDHAQLFLQPLELLHADVVAAAHNHHHRAQVLCQLALGLQPFDNVIVHSCQSGTTGRLHQDLFIICTERKTTQISVMTCLCS